MAQQIIRIAHSNHLLTLGQYVRIIKTVKASAPGTEFASTLETRWPGTREDILRQFYGMVQDKINLHLTIRELSDSRVHKLLKQHVTSSCRWCGASLNRYEPKHNQFCAGSSCKRDYYG